MTTNEIVKTLKVFCETVDRSTYEKLALTEAVDKLSQLQQLIDDQTNDHYVDVLDFYAERCQKLEEDFTELVMKSPEICEYCKHNTECKGKDCPKYVNGRGCTNENGKYIDWKWSCEDFDYGDCPLLESTPCNGCIQNENKGFEWRGSQSH